MIISRHKLEIMSKETNFIIDNLEKVLRLSAILNYLNNDIIFERNKEVQVTKKVAKAKRK